jgi:hypothetical protein
MDDNVVWCALILAVAYVSRHMLPSYYEITSVRRHSLDNMRDDILALEESVETLIKRVDAINNQVDDDEQDLMGALKKIEDMQSDVAGHLTRLDDIDGRAIVGLRAVNVLDESNAAVRHVFQFLVGGKWIDVPVENVWEKADD